MQSRGYVVRNQAQSALLGAPVVRLAIPSSVSPRRALSQVRSAAPAATVAVNDLYRRSRVTQYRPAGQGCGTRCEAFELAAWTPGTGRCTAGLPIGVIDTAVDTDHPSLAGLAITVRTTRSSDRRASDAEHGTGVVSLLAGRSSSEVSGLTEGARVLAADAFHGSGDASTADAFDLIVSLDWLAAEGVRVVNLSLTGPDNAVLKRAVEQTLERGIALVVAAGRPDAENKLGYPARYDGVVAVSAIDSRLRPSRLSARGPHIAFAAPGVGLMVAAPGNRVRRVDGTSFAAPFVTAAYARGLANGKSPTEIEGAISRGAKDLGAAGRDPVFGHGLIQFSALPSC